MQFEYYVLNYNFNKGRMETFNIFNNTRVQKETETEIKKYLRSPKTYKGRPWRKNELIGFEALCYELRLIIMSEMWARREYEISVSDAFIPEIRDVLEVINNYSTINELKEELIKKSERTPNLEKWDCFMQCEKNIPMIARECIYQYKQYLKNNKEKT